VIAQESITSFVAIFFINTLSLAQLEKAMYLVKLGEQTVLKSKKSFEHIRFIRSEAARREIYYPMRQT